MYTNKQIKSTYKRQLYTKSIKQEANDSNKC